MSPGQKEFLSLPHRPLVLSIEQCAWFLGFTEEEVCILGAAGLLRPLGNPKQNEKRYFATVTVEEFGRNPAELNRARIAIRDYWRRKNQTRKNAGSRLALHEPGLNGNGAKKGAPRS